MKKRHRSSAPQLLFEDLEPRLLFSADWEGVFVDRNMIDQDTQELYQPIVEEVTESESSLQGFKTPRELVFIDTDVEDYQVLLDDIRAQGSEGRNIDVILLDNNRDGIGQITDVLAGYENLDAVHLISHGSDGSVDIGNTRLDSEALNNNLTAIGDWANAFSENGDFLIYGCNLAATEDGQSLIDSLSRLTQTDVAASDDLTGQTVLGGDWNLEYAAGSIETAIAISADVQCRTREHNCLLSGRR